MEYNKMIKKLYREYKKIRKNANDIHKVKRQISMSSQPIPKLTRNQKQEILSFWNRYNINVPTYWHQLLYAKTGKQLPDYIPELTFHQIIKPKMNNYMFSSVWGDKSYIDLFINKVSIVKSVVRNVNGRFLNEKFDLISSIEAQTILEQYDQLVVKPSTFTDTGKGVQLLKSPFSLNQISKLYKKNYVIQLPLNQHNDIAELNRSSINTIRVNSVLFENEAYIMSAFIKVGQSGSFADNQGKNRYFIGITENGEYCDYAINHDLENFSHIPSGYEFAGKKVPGYQEVCETVKKAHKCIAHFGFAFWDVCVDITGKPIIVEVNLRYPDTVIPQVCTGKSFFGPYTERILKFIAKDD